MSALDNKSCEALAKQDEIRTLTLRFASHMTAMRFGALCERYGHRPAHGRDGVWHTVTAAFQNKAARSKLVRAWARESMLVSE
jgi:hypothetical protein